MMNGYYYGYSTPMMNYLDYGLVTAIVAVVAALIGVILYFTLFSKKNEDRFTGFKGKLYNLMTFNRFYAEDILKFLYVIATCMVTACGIAIIVMGSFLSGITLLVLANIALRVVFELLMMFIMLCRKTVAMDRKLGRIADYYDDGYDEFGGGAPEMSREEWEEDLFGEEDEFACGGDCGSCSSEDCGSFDDAEITDIIQSIKEDQQ